MNLLIFVVSFFIPQVFAIPVNTAIGFREWLQIQDDYRYTGGQRSKLMAIAINGEIHGCDGALKARPNLLEIELSAYPPEWSKIETWPLQEWGFSIWQIVEIARTGKLTAQEVQDSIHYFAFDLKTNDKTKEFDSDPRDFLMRHLLRGIPYPPPQNYVSLESACRRNYLDYIENLHEL